MPNIFDDSQAWQRLHEPLPETVPFDIRTRFHDINQVFQSMLVATVALQTSHELTSKQIEKSDSKFDDLNYKLFDPELGTFARMREKLDRRLNRISGLAVTILVAVLVSTITYVITTH